MESEREYMRRRAAEEQAAADGASSEKARRSHSELAERYRDAARTCDAVRTRRELSKAHEPELVRGLPMEFRIIE